MIYMPIAHFPDKCYHQKPVNLNTSDYC